MNRIMLNWKVKTILIEELKEYEHNPRVIDKKEFAKLVRSIKEDGYHQRILVNTDLTIIGGHQRKRALLAAGMQENDTIEVLVPERTLTAEELDRINIRDNLLYGKYDFDVLSNRFELDTLIDFGIPEEWLEGFMGIEESSTEKEEEQKIDCHCECHLCNCECHAKKSKHSKRR